MNWSRLRSNGNENVFKGSHLVTSILERHSKHFRSRATALKFCRQLFNDGIIKGVFGADSFEDSVQLYTWKDQNDNNMTSQPGNSPRKSYGYSSADITLTKRELFKQKETIKQVGNTRQTMQANTVYQDHRHDYFKDVQTGNEQEEHHHMTSHPPHLSSYHTSWNLKRASTASSESSVDILSHSYGKHKDKNALKSPYNTPSMTHSRDHDAIPEEVPEEPLPVMERTGTSTEYDGSSSIPRSVTTDASGYNDMDGLPQRRWQQDFQNSYSDNEKQLIEQMKRMKKEHSHILRTYEDRINKLMAKMHELRSIAEMLENSSSKSSPYAMVTNKPGVLSFLSSKSETERKLSSAANGCDVDNPPPLPPRPGRGSRLNPNKPVIQTEAKMKVFPWTRIILTDDSTDEHTTIWHTMVEPKLDAEEIERLFSTPMVSQTDGATLYDDLIIRRGRSRQQLVSIYDTERSKRIVVCMKCLRATLNDIVASVSSLDTSQINHEGLAELMELLSPSADIDKILFHVRKKGAGHLDHPEYLVFELSKVDHFKDRLEFIRFRFKLLWHLFEIDQQLRELHTACDEIINSTSLKNLLETLLAVGNYLNGATEMGQADGFGLDVLNKMKEFQDRDGKGTLLEFVLKTYCQIYENEVEIGCPTRFRLPEPSNMRHASQVSFEGIQDALSNLHSDLRHIRERLLDPRVNKDVMRPMDSFRVSAENFFAAALEVIGEQEKVLQDTRDVFDKTTAYYLIDNHQVTPQQFFQIWAVFLHDCKYFWKLAHRRLAKERFELEFKYKGQVSACSLQGYGTFRAGVLKGVDSSNSSDPKTSTAQRKANRLKENPDSSRPNVPPKPNRSKHIETHYHADHVERPPSPKPLTSSPPSSVDVYKPMPKAPLPSNHLTPNAPLRSPPNYENQSELDRIQNKYPHRHHHQPHQQPSSLLNGNPGEDHSPASLYYDKTDSSQTPQKDKKSSQQFSLKAWLKREREQVRKGVESETMDSPPVDTKVQSPSRPFARFKNSMIQKFSSGSSTKKQETKRPKESNDSPLKTNHRGFADSDLQSNMNIENPNYIPDHYSVRESGALQLDSLEEYNRPVPDTIISPIDDPECDEQIVQNQNFIDSKTIKSAPEIRVNDESIVQNGDFNNNKFLDGQLSEWGRQTSNKGFQNSQVDTYTPRRGEFSPSKGRDGDGYPQTHGRSADTDTKRIVAQTVPLYKARIINNYENQGKFETPRAIRQQAEPVQPSAYRDQQVDARGQFDEEKRTENRLQNVPNPKDIHNVKVAENPYSHSSHRYHQHPSSDHNPYGHYTRSGKAQHLVSPQKDTPIKSAFQNKDFSTPGTRVPMNVQSIGSLIDKYDKYNNSSVETHQHGSGQMPATTTNVVDSKSESEKSPPLPPRMSLSPERQKKPMEKVSENRNTNGNLFPETEKITSPYSRLDNLTTNNLSPHSVYTTPPMPSTHQTPNKSQHNGYSGFYTPPTNTPHSNSSQTQNTPAVFNTIGSQSYYTPPSKSGQSNAETNANMNTNYQKMNGNLPNGFAHSNGMDQSGDRDDGYRAQLRRAANLNQSAYDKFSKTPTQYSGRQSFGTPENGMYPYTSPKTAVVNNEEVSYMAF